MSQTPLQEPASPLSNSNFQTGGNKLMHKSVLMILLPATMLLAAGSLMAQKSTEPADTLTDEQRTLYAFGLSLAQSAARFNLTPKELELVTRGLADGVQKRPAFDL